MNFNFDSDEFVKVIVSQGFNGRDVTVTGVIITNEAGDDFCITKDKITNEFVMGRVDIQRIDDTMK